MDRLFLGVVRLRKAMQEHRRRSDVLASPSELWGIIPPVDDVVLYPTSATPPAACRVPRMGRIMVRRARRCRWWLVLSPLSLLLAMLLRTREGLRTRVRRGLGL